MTQDQNIDFKNTHFMNRGHVVLARDALTGRYSSVVERALRKRTVVGSIPTGGSVSSVIF